MSLQPALQKRDKTWADEALEVQKWLRHTIKREDHARQRWVDWVDMFNSKLQKAWEPEKEWTSEVAVGQA